MDEYEGYFDDFEYEDKERPPDPAQEQARERLRKYFEDKKEAVFFSRQIEVQFENDFFHWVTNRALTDLIDEGLLQSEKRELTTGGTIKLMWNRRYRYYKRAANRVVALVEEYADPNIGASLGLVGEMLVLEGFARKEFVMKDRNTNVYGGRKWTESGHDLDFIFWRDSVAYGVEVKNKLGYMEYDEFKTKIPLCIKLGIHPVFVVRMIPKNWIHELSQAGGFALILKYQLYPWTHRKLAVRIAKEFGVPVDAPKSLYEGTMERFMRWHKKNV